ncbi:hypothetical protein D3C85_1271910 [compost metagenome]
MQPAQYWQAELSGQLAHAFENIALGPTEYDQSPRQVVVGQVPNQRQPIGARHLQVADGHIDAPAPRQ